ncbi:MAG: hypothetical protein FWC21_06020 [Treponema sp.]|nr:hypothetical protein [Treponema sp.]
MKKNILFILSILLIFLLFVISCAGQPAAVDEPVTQTPQPAPAAATPSAAPSTTAPADTPAAPAATAQVDPAARSAAQAARQQALDFSGNSYFPSEWEALERRYNSANSTDEFNALTAEYNQILKQSANMYALDMEHQILSARQEIIDTGLVRYAPEYLRDADIVALEALSQYEADDYYAARDTANTALSKYEAILYATNVYTAREELMAIINGGWSDNLLFNSWSYIFSADETFFAAVDQYDAGNYDQAKAIAGEALEQYETLIIGADVYLTRERLIETGLVPLAPQYLDAADVAAFKALEQYEAGNYADAKIFAAQAKDNYDELWFAADIYMTRQSIIDLDFAGYDAELFARADEVALAAIADFDAGNKSAAFEKALDAQLRYNMIIDNAWPVYATEKRNSAVSEKQHAVDERADVAARAVFNEADSYLNEAYRLYELRQYESASQVFTNAQALFTIAIEETIERRRVALDTIRIAEEMIERSSGTAREAERIIEGGSR